MKELFESILQAVTDTSEKMIKKTELTPKVNEALKQAKISSCNTSLQLATDQKKTFALTNG